MVEGEGRGGRWVERGCGLRGHSIQRLSSSIPYRETDYLSDSIYQCRVPLKRRGDYR